MKNTRYIIFLISLFAFVQNGSSQILEWNGSTDINWSNPLNWTPNIAPGPGFFVVIEENSNDIYPTLIGTQSIAGIAVFEGASLHIAINSSLTTGDTFLAFGITSSFFNEGTISNFGTIDIGAVQPSGDRALWNYLGGTFTNGSVGIIKVSKAETFGLFSESTFHNHGDIMIGEVSSPSMTTGMRIESGTFTNHTDGTIEVNRSSTNAIQLNGGTLANSGDIDVGNNNASGSTGILISSGFLDNEASGEIVIEDVSTTGIDCNGTLHNSNLINFIMPSGTSSLVNTGTVHNIADGSLLSFNSLVSASELRNSGDFLNNGFVVMGQTNDSGIVGLENLGTFTNSFTGTVRIDRATTYGLRNYATHTFTNNGFLYIGDDVSNGDYGLYNEGIFQNDGGDIFIDRSTEWALGNLSFATFTNTSSATLRIGHFQASGLVGIYNSADMTVSSGTVFINRVSSVGISNQTSGEYTTSGSGTTRIGNTSITAGNGIQNNGEITTTGSSATLEINKVSSAAFFNQSQGIYTNAASATTRIGNLTGTFDYGLYNEGTITSTGSGSDIEINNTEEVAIFNDTGGTFMNSNGSDTEIGHTSNSGNFGIVNNGDFTNTGIGSILEINRVTDSAIKHEDGTFKNLTEGEIKIGNLAGSFTNGINSSDNLEIGIDATVHINRYTNTGYSNQSGGHLNCDGHLTIGNTVDSGDYGIINSGSISLDLVATIDIDNTDLQALRNQTGATLTMSGDITIGDIASVGEYGVYNFGSVNLNTILAVLKINRATINGVYTSSSWTSQGQISIGSEDSNFETGFFNSGGVSLTAGGLYVDRCSVSGVENTGTLTSNFLSSIEIGETASVGLRGLVNSGTINSNTAIFTIDRSSITGILNQGTFNNNQFIIRIGQISSTGQYGIVNESILNCTEIAIYNATTAGLLNSGAGSFKVNGSYLDYSN